MKTRSEAPSNQVAKHKFSPPTTRGITKNQQYQLDQNKAIKKKAQHCNRQEPIKFNSTGGGLRFYCQTGLYEVLKTTLPEWLTNTKYKDNTQLTEKTDKGGNVVETFISIGRNPRLYTINLYHTTSSGLVNGNALETFCKEDFPEMLNLVENLDININEINKKCKDTLDRHMCIHGAREEQPVDRVRKQLKQYDNSTENESEVVDPSHREKCDTNRRPAVRSTEEEVRAIFRPARTFTSNFTRTRYFACASYLTSRHSANSLSIVMKVDTLISGGSCSWGCRRGA